MIDRVTTLPIDHFPNVSRKYVLVKGSVDLEETVPNGTCIADIRFEREPSGIWGDQQLYRNRAYLLVKRTLRWRKLQRVACRCGFRSKLVLDIELMLNINRRYSGVFTYYK